MGDLDLKQLKDELKRDEGLRLKPYTDTVGKLTIGVGRNLTDRGLSEDEIDMLLANDIALVEASFDKTYPWWRGMTDARQRAFVNFGFAGVGTVAGFPKMLKALQAGDYDTAAAELLDSRYAEQVGARATRLAQMIQEG